ncbi:MAG TPA: SUMF1/EgtB/PvdO family nonheme iron enzyme [Pirellulales bacterium]|nr:SUMF1/EgtB/PvdO family nonheme iron enzyme [Pirellulales bacterium]
MKLSLSPLVAFLVVLLCASLVYSAEEPDQRWALLIGVDDYAELEDLRYAGADVRALKQELLGRGFDPQNVFVVEDHAAETKYRPSKGNIERQLKLVMELADRNDLVLIAFSGHGVHVDGKSYLCPADALLDDADTLVSLDWVYERLKRCPAALKLMVVDACRDDPRLGGRRGPQSADVTSRFAADLERPPQGVVILNSCAPGQASMEEKQFGHGVFMHFLIEGLHGGADDNRDGRVSLGELSQFAGLQTKRYVARQFNGVQTPKLQGDLATDVLAFDLGMRGGLPGGRASSPSLGDAPIEGLASPPHDGAPHETFTNSIGMRFTLIPAGEFLMGSDESVADIEQAFGKHEWLKSERIAAEHPKHRVRITKPFFLGVYEVAKEQFKRFVEAEDYRTDAEKDGEGGYGWSQNDKAFTQKAEYTWRSWGVNQSDSSPVVNVSWNDAVAFCQWLSGKEGKGYRLPTEAEWEYACRARTTTRFYNGDDPESLVKIGNVRDGTARETFTWWTYTVKAKDGFAFTCAAGRFRPNLFGLYDMTGNAAEWCADWYSEDYYADSPLDDPQGPAAGSFRAIRGGGWIDLPVACRSAYRNIGTRIFRLNQIGFRVVCER